MRFWYTLLLFGFIFDFISGIGKIPCAAQTAKTKRNLPNAPKSHNSTLPIPDAETYERRVLQLTNLERKKVGLPPFVHNPTLAKSARWLAQEMGEKNYFAHTDKQGRGIEPRLPDFGYTNYETLGENIAAGQPTPEAVVDAWIHSEKHRHNIFNPDHTELGVGFAFVKGSEFRTYWVQDFGNRFDYYPVVINDGGETTTCEVHLHLYGEKWAQQVRFSGDGKTWTDWEPYTPSRNWTLEVGEGIRTVYVEYRRGEKILTAQDSVRLVKAKPNAKPAQTADGKS